MGKVVDGGVTIPLNSAGAMTDGYGFVEMASREDAEKALAATNNWNMDPRHKLSVYRFEDYRAYVAEPDDEEWKTPAPAELKAQADQLAWLMDEAGRDQFAIAWESAAVGDRHQEVLWCDGKRPPMVDFFGDTDASSHAGQAWRYAGAMKWSPQGTYMTTLAQPGARIWSGSRFAYGHGFKHAGVREVVWAVNEKWLFTWNGGISNPTPDRAIIVWDALTGREVRAFKQRNPHDDVADMAWSGDGKYLARLDTDAASKMELIKVYEMPTCTLLDSRSIKASGAIDFSWSPGMSSGSLIAWWSPEVDNTPTAVAVMRLPSREVVRQRNLFNVDKVDLAWHPDGWYLAVLAAKSPKKKKAMVKGEKITRGEPARSAPATVQCVWHTAPPPPPQRCSTRRTSAPTATPLRSCGCVRRRCQWR